MFDLFKQDIKVGDKVKLYLTTGKEPEGTVISIGDNFVLLQGNDINLSKFFEKIIGGWDIITPFIKPNIDYKTIGISNTERDFEIGISTLIDKLEEKNVLIEQSINSKILIDNNQYLEPVLNNNDEITSQELDHFIEEQINNESKFSPISDTQLWRAFIKVTGIKVKRKKVVTSRKNQGFANAEFRIQPQTNIINSPLNENDNIELSQIPSSKIFNTFEGLKDIVAEQELNRFISPNAEINKYISKQEFGTAQNQEITEIRFRKDVIFDNDLISTIEKLEKGNTIPIVCLFYTVKNGKTFASVIVKPDYVLNFVNRLKIAIQKNELETANKLITVLKRNKVELPIINELKAQINFATKNNNQDRNKTIIETNLDQKKTEIVSSDPTSNYEAARKLRLKKQFDESEKLFLSVIEQKYQIDSAVKDLADQYREQGRLNEAISLVEKYFNIFEKKEQGYNFLYDLYTSNGELEKARETLENYVATDFNINDQIVKRRRGKAYARLGALTLKIKEFEKAKIFFKKAEELYPNNKQLKSALSTINFQNSSKNIVGKEEYFDENLFDSLVYGISPFLKYALENCTYEGVPLTTKTKKIFNDKTLTELRELIEKTKEGRPELRAKYKGFKSIMKQTTKNERYRIPEKLVKSLLF